MLKDRGTIKWTSLMLPEHVEQLKKLWDDNNKIQKPILDEQELEELNHLCLDAYRNQTTVELSVYANGEIKLIRGIITKVDVQNRIFYSQTTSTVKKVPFTNLIQIKRIE